MNDIILKEIDSLRQILVANKPVENITEREDIVNTLNKVKDLTAGSDSEAIGIINNGVEALEKAVEAFLNLNKNKVQDKEFIEVEVPEDLPENARPFQAIAFDKKKPLQIQEAVSYFNKEDQAVSQMPYKPKSGEVILFRAKSAKHLNDWRSNGHRWNQRNGGRVCLNGIITRKVANIVTPTSGKSGLTAFQRISWTHRDKPMLILVQFVGDDSLSVDFPHKNSKKPIPYIRSAPSLLRDLEVGKEKPFKEYQGHVFNAPPDATSQHLFAPRNITQVRKDFEKRRREQIH